MGLKVRGGEGRGESGGQGAEKELCQKDGEKKPLGLGWCWEGTEKGTEMDREMERDRQRETTKGSGREGRRERKAVMEI